MAPVVAEQTVERPAEQTGLLDAEQIAELLNVALTGVQPAAPIAGRLGAERAESAAIAACGQIGPYAVHFVEPPNAEQTVELLDVEQIVELPNVEQIAVPNAGLIVVQPDAVQTVGLPNAAQTAELQTVEPDAAEPTEFGPTAEQWSVKHYQSTAGLMVLESTGQALLPLSGHLP